ncbi:hypothetical protein [Peptoniphilus rhinitidis]|uniref:hypothetical protein n=1 Tax=Peptoniphilus rhinitidis TaxID=1175452 RepID=UPI0002891BE7|nr:hypothetical protein [Peptoniphilus rhinitidis]
MKTKRELLNNILVAEELLKDIKEDFIRATKNEDDDEVYLYYNTRQINRNRITINEKLKDLERYQ